MSTLNLKPAHLLTVGAVLFAGYALWASTKKPGGSMSTQPAQQIRDAALDAWNNLQNSQASMFDDPNTYAAGPAAIGGVQP